MRNQYDPSSIEYEISEYFYKMDREALEKAEKKQDSL